jgi:hypothetical protein
MSVTFGMISPAQLDPDRAQQLARLHLQGFFLSHSYDRDRREGGFVPRRVGHVAEANRPDWGNALMRAFADRTRMWDTHLICVLRAGLLQNRHP